MDISKIRKKAKEQGADRDAAARPPRDAEPVKAAENVEQVTEGTEEEAPAASEVPVKAGEPAPAEKTISGQDPSENSGKTELLTFIVGTEEFAFRVDEVEEILRLQKITFVPTLPDYVRGITSLRGKIIPVIGLRPRLGLRSDVAEEVPDEDSDKKQDAKILIISAPKGIVGAMVDKVMGVVGISKESIIEPPAHLTEAELKYIEGVVILDKRFIAVIRAGETMDIEI